MHLDGVRTDQRAGVFLSDDGALLAEALRTSSICAARMMRVASQTDRGRHAI